MTSIPTEFIPALKKRHELSSWLAAMNQLESMAAAFVSGVADEQVGFRAIGRTYCFTVEHNYDLLAFARTGQANPYWANIVDLSEFGGPD
jgi:hypothetical protein